MRAVFLADAHLKGPGDAAQARLVRFLDELAAGGPDTNGAPGVDHLVIAGDFFDFWFARGDAIYPGFRPVVERLARLRSRGVRISLCEGNHDFFLGDYFAERLGAEVYPEGAELDLDGRRVFVSHGDTVDRANRRYLALRRFLRSTPARLLQRTLPLAWLWGIARLSSQASKGMSGPSRERLTRIMHRWALDRFREGYDAVVLGHCHEPFLCEEVLDGRPRTFATLGDWISHDSYLRCEDGRFSLERFD